MATMEVVVESPSGRVMQTITLAAEATLGDLKKKFASLERKYYVERQEFRLKPASDAAAVGGKPAKPVAIKGEDKLLKEFAPNDKSLKLVFKDLGAQISWRTVFLVEYFGPLFIHPLLYYFPQFFYSAAPTQKHEIQTIALYCVLFHYAKRELETIFVHRFSNATMPWFNIIKNSTHYWFLSGLMIAYFLYHPLYTAPAWLVAQPPIVLRGLVALFVFAELNNFWCHMILRNLRPANSKARGIPKGNLFSLVSCANYTWEVLAWVVFSVFTQTATSYFFALVSFGQILVWAIKKHKAYRVEFPDYPRRKALIPFIV